jgi:predicted nucleic acid-binding Zn ribbon protein
MEINEKACLNCGKALKGRIDKKFCDDSCRNNFNNKLNTEKTNLVRNINNVLIKNRRILSLALPEKEGMKKITRHKLLEMGFNFKYHTHQYQNQKGQIYYFVYEYGYLPLEDDWLLLVKRKDK